jgi:magnesium transporter
MRRKKLVKKTPKIAGSAPGTLVHVGERKAERIGVQIIEYTSEHLAEREFSGETIADCSPLKGAPTVSWINVDGIHEIGQIEALANRFGLHPLVQEDILDTEHRPKFENYDDYIFLVLKMLQFNGEHGEISTEQVSLILGPSYVISFQERQGDVFDAVRERLRLGKGRIRRMGADYLAYALLDSIVDSYFAILEKIGDEIEILEEELVTDPGKETMARIHHFKREMILLRRSIWPLREVVSGLQREESPLVTEGVGLYLRDVYDHTIQVIDTVETFRDIISGMLDLYLSSVSNRMNEVMKVLTIIATIFIPLTFFAGIYGMNFEYMPELHWKYSYPLLWLLMVGSAAGMLVFFRRKKWL